jgi:hypothetical protein
MLHVHRLVTGFPAHAYKCRAPARNVAVTHHWYPSNIMSLNPVIEMLEVIMPFIRARKGENYLHSLWNHALSQFYHV